MLFIKFALLALFAQAPNAELLESPRSVSSENGVLNTVLELNSFRFKSDIVHFNTRGYNNSLPGPTLRVKPGDVMKIKLKNNLGPETEKSTDGDVGFLGWNHFKLPNTTNLHFHGLHVNPHGNADNVHVKVDPGESFDYEVKIPEDHPAGTFFYHAHFHGSVAIQLGGGAAGALIIEDKPEDLTEDVAEMKEHLLVLTHLLFKPQQYDGSNYGSKLYNHHNNNMRFITEKTESDLELDVTTPEQTNGIYGDHENCFVVNGQWLPTIQILPGEVTRFRIVNAAAAESLSLSLEYDADLFQEQSKDEVEDGDEKWLDGQDICEMHIIAMDGIYLKEPWKVSTVHLVPGSRADLAIKCNSDSDKKQTLYLGSAITHETQTYVGATAHIHNGAIAIIDVMPGQPLINQKIPTILPKIGYLENLDLLDEDENEVEDEFTVDWSRHNYYKPKVTRQWAVNGAPYKRDDILTEMHLGKVAEWKIGNDDYHPFHIHTHHFQIKKVPRKGYTAQELLSLRPGMWRDTIPSDRKEKSTVIHIMPLDYKGIQLAHCHVGSHSDQGMAFDFRVIGDDYGGLSAVGLTVGIVESNDILLTEEEETAFNDDNINPALNENLDDTIKEDESDVDNANLDVPEDDAIEETEAKTEEKTEEEKSEKENPNNGTIDNKVQTQPNENDSLDTVTKSNNNDNTSSHVYFSHQLVFATIAFLWLF